MEDDEDDEDEEEDEPDLEHAEEHDPDTDGKRVAKKVLREINIRDCFRPESNDSVFLSADFNQMVLPTYTRTQPQRS